MTFDPGLNLSFLTRIDLTVAKWLRLHIELPFGTAMIFTSEKLKDDCMTEKLRIIPDKVRQKIKGN